MRRVIVIVIGGTLLLLALVGIILPIMPGFVFIPLALAILAFEFTWAARWLRKMKHTASGVHQRIKSGFRGRKSPNDDQEKKQSPTETCQDQ